MYTLLHVIYLVSLRELIVKNMERIPIENFTFSKYDDVDVINSWKWFMSFLSKKDWQKRKANIENNIAVKFRTTEPFTEPLTGGTLIVVKDDIIGWYLYLVDMLINEPHKYEYFQGARVIPIFKRFGIDLDILKNIEGVNIRMRELLRKRRSEADALLFEMLTALLWAKNGYQVAFIPEENGEKTPDLLAKANGKIFNIECKRQSKTSDYTYKETKKRQSMVSHIGEILLERNILLDIVFHVELETLSDTFLKDLLYDKLKTANSGNIISNEIVTINLSFVDISFIKKHLESNFVKHNSPMLNKLIGEKSVDNKSFTCGLFAHFFRVGEGEVNNLYISDIQNAYGIYWGCDAKEALWAKARDIKNQLYKAMKQFKSENTAIIHVGVETYDGPEVEKTRLIKINQTIEKIKPENTSLRWVFCHFFQSYSPPNQDWVFDETVSMMSAYIYKKPPLDYKLMVVPDSGDIESNIFHWNKPLP